MIAFAMSVPVHPVRTFLSPDSALGFGTGDYLELLAAVMLLAFVVFWAMSRRVLTAANSSRIFWLCFLTVLPAALRLALLRQCPVPIPSGADDFSYVLLADTLRHFRLANPPHAFPEFFEQMFVLQEPTYSSMFPLGQGIFLAVGWLIFGHPWAGVLLSVCALCGSCYWMLRGWTSPGWALAGGTLAVIQFGPLSYWTNSYWGGAVAATAGCLVFGSLPRIQTYRRQRDAVILGIGLALELLTRPFECWFLLLSVLVFAAPAIKKSLYLRSALRKISFPVIAILLAAGGLIAMQNRRVTGQWTTLPYTLAQYQYGIPSTFTFQANPVPHRSLNDEQDLAYRAQTIIHGTGKETLGTYTERLAFRLRFLRFFLLPPLYVAAVAFIIAVRDFRFAWVLITIGCFLLGSNFYPYFYPHYIAAISCLFLLIATVGMEKLNGVHLGGIAAPIQLGTVLLLICMIHFTFWLAVHFAGGREMLSVAAEFEPWEYLNYGDPQGRISVDRQLSVEPGKKLVFVHYLPGHRFAEWVHNAADIDKAQVIWVHDLGAEKNEQLLRTYPDRHPWLLEPDQIPPRLTPYAEETGGFQDVR